MNKILFVIGATSSGGAEKRAILTATILKDRFDTNVFAFHGEKSSNIDFVFKNSYRDYKKTSVKKRIRSLRKYIDTYNPDTVISFMPHINLITTFALRPKKYKKIKHVVAMAHYYFDFKNSVFLKYSIKKADAVYYQSVEQKEYFDTKHFNFVLSNPIKIPKLEKKNCKYKFISVGRLEPQKDFELLIKSFYHITKEISEASLDIFGNGSQKDKLLSLISDLKLESKVTIHEYTKDIAKEYQSHDVFLFTSRREGFPNVLAEAMANGLICFSTIFKTGCKELLIDNETGYICYSRDPFDFSSIVVNKLKEYDSAKKVAENGYEHISSVCDINVFKDKIEEKIKTLNKI